MIEIVWTLLLTVCSDTTCATQHVQWFEKKPECIEMKVVHEDLPIDGNWKSVDYKCTVVGAEEV